MALHLKKKNKLLLPKLSVKSPLVAIALGEFFVAQGGAR